jgi:hypothetical protein
MIAIPRAPRRFAKECFLLGALLFFSIPAFSAEWPGPQPAASPVAAQADPAASGTLCDPSRLGSPYVNVDSWVYPAVLRLYSLGYVDHVFIGIRPWTRTSIVHMLEDAGDRIQNGDRRDTTDEAQKIYESLQRELSDVTTGPCGPHQGVARVESAYTEVRGISGTSLRDSYHLGQTVINDYGRPYESGFNNYTGASGYVNAGRYTLYARGEFQFSPSADGYSQDLANSLSMVDLTSYAGPHGVNTFYFPQTTIPLGPISSTAQGRILEAYASALILNHEFSFGKMDQWLGPGQGASFAYSNNAENIYGFQINRVEPLRIPGLSLLTGPFRYAFLIGPTQGHQRIDNPAFTGDTTQQPNVITPGNPWVHVEKIGFRPTDNLEFGFSRTAIFGGKGHSPVTLHTFLKSFFSTVAGNASEKNGRDDPGARFATFDFSYRLPYLRNWLTLYTDGEVHDDVSPIDAPRRAAWRPGLYLSHVPGLPKLDARVEAAYTDMDKRSSNGGLFMYWETIERQGYTNQGQIFGDWIGREAKGGQAWLTWHLGGNEWIQVNARNHKAAKDFLHTATAEYGSTINDLGFQVVKRFRNQFEINGNFTVEKYKEPMYLPGEQTVTTTSIRLTWYPEHKVTF